MDQFLFLRDWAKRHPNESALIMAGVALAAAAAAVGQFVDLQTDIPTILFVLAGGLVVILLVAMLKDPVIALLLRWFALLLATGWVVLFAFNTLRPGWREMDCLVYFWRSCRVVADEAAPPPTASGVEWLSGTPAVPNAPAAAASIPVFTQFAGFNRDDIRVVMGELAKAGWNMQGLSRGGERTTAAARQWEIRYSGDLEPLAKALAASLRQSLANAKQPAKPLNVVSSPRVAPGRLEIWISL
ncbi:hypothetical protein [Ancylobacter sp. G4_0304]|uniref:hypothetical protein n=1 Tax=Ancylobacter sp. G4_0304 TaxID=3114289 RepID=UPI0039C5F6A1